MDKELNAENEIATDSSCSTGPKSSGFKLKHWHIIAIYLVIYDIIAVNASYFVALLLRFDMSYSSIPEQYLDNFIMFAPIYTIFALIVFAVLHLYNSLWRFASFSELNRIIMSSVLTTAFQLGSIIVTSQRMPVSYYVFGAVFQICLVTGVRFGYRYISLQRTRIRKSKSAAHNVMIIGAGAAGQMILKELTSSAHLSSKPCCIIDDNPNKWGRIMDGVPVEGGRDSIMNAVEKYEIDRILVAIPSASPQEKRDILNICKETHCQLKSLPGVYQLAKGEVSLSKMKDVAVEDLLGRDTIQVNTEEIFNSIKGKTILVTGGGGSIGSELCRQIADHEPGHLIIFDIYENNAYDIEQELKRKHGAALNMTVLIGSVRDIGRLNMVFEKYRPEIVYHAAAHKHVPLMESSPNEAIKNNTIGTYKTARAAVKYGAERFVLVSTDKAVNPTNIMGASKRLCEMVIQCMDALCKKNNEAATFVAVRFGNVLGSNGSVVPLFKKQIEEGGPVTVTHPDIVRYFMTIPEAVSLIMQASTYAKGGEIFVLDMGEPVKIDTLARNLIKLSGYEPGVDIKLEYTGLRPGEKLYEEKLMEEEGLKRTENDLIHIGSPIPFDPEEFMEQLKELDRRSAANDEHIVEFVKTIVPTFHPIEEESWETANMSAAAADKAHNINADMMYMENLVNTAGGANARISTNVKVKVTQPPAADRQQKNSAAALKEQFA